MSPKFEIEILEDAKVFIANANEKARVKMFYNMRKAQIVNDPKLFKKLNDNIWEFRTLFNGLQYRLLAFWDKTTPKTTLVIATHGFIKKQDKVPPNEINRAEEIRKKYFESKK